MHWYSLLLAISLWLPLSTALEEYYHTNIPWDSISVPAGTRLARLNIVALEKTASCKFKDAAAGLVLTTAHHKAGRNDGCKQRFLHTIV